MKKEDDLKAFGKRLRQARKAAGLSQTDLGERVGKSLNTISGWESGTVRPDDPFTVLRAAQAVGKPIGWLLGEEPPKAQEEAMEAGARLYMHRVLEMVQRDLASPVVFEYPDVPKAPSVGEEEQGRAG